MLISLLLLSAAPTVSGHALTDADVVTVVPRLDKVPQALPFFEAAGSRSVVLRPSSWRELTHPLLQLDATSKESLASAGVDPAGSLTLSRRGELELSCVTLVDAKKHAAACDERLARLGTVTRKDEGGVVTVSARDPINRVLAAYVIKGKEACAATSHGYSLEKTLPELAKLLAGKPTVFKAAAELEGVVYFIKPEGSSTGAMVLNTSGLSATIDAKAKGAPLGQLAGPGSSPFAGFAPQGLMTLRARVTKPQVLSFLEPALRNVPGGQALLAPATTLAPALTGNVAVYVQQVKVQGTLRTREGRFFALKTVVLAETTDAALAASLIEQLDAKSLSLKEGTLTAGIQGNVVWVANDVAAKDAALAALPAAASKQTHAVEFEVSPALVAKGLGQIPLLEAVQNETLAGLLAASTEVGPLLLVSDKLTGWLDPAGVGVYRGQLTWPLRADKFGVDAGR